jgi:hypothetical protein
MTDHDSNCQRAVLGLITMDENGMPDFLRTIPSDALTDLDRKRFGADAQFAGSTGVAVNLKLASVLDTEDIDFSIHDSLQQ